MAAPPPAAIVADAPPPPPADVDPSEGEKTDNILCSTYGIDAVCCCCNTCFIVPERQVAVELLLGNYHGTITEPGFYCRNGCLVELRRVTTAINTIDLPNTKVADSRGNPLMVSGIVTYEVVNARRAAIDISDPFSFVSNQAPAVLKRVISQFPYESADPNEPSLRKEAGTVSEFMKTSLQERVNVAGVRIESFALNELSYAPEIAQSMLKRQQADALIEARQRIVQGATDIARSAVDNKALSAHITQADKSRLLSNLLVVLVSDKDATPVVQL